jgi:hypothetical protein
MGNLPADLIQSASEVLTIFLMPFGGGIPAGVILAKQHGIDWQLTSLLYFISDLILACLFEPLMHLFIRFSKRSLFLTRFIENYKMMMSKSGFKYGNRSGPIALIAIAFGVDPMTGRAAAKASGHGFFSGWALAIFGDMFFFGLIMASTLFLNNVLGNGSMAALIIMVAMIGVPMLVERFKSRLPKAGAKVGGPKVHPKVGAKVAGGSLEGILRKDF